MGGLRILRHPIGFTPFDRRGRFSSSSGRVKAIDLKPIGIQ
jgi:hypothetical protein